MLVSALNEDLDRVSVPYAAQVMRESFLKSAGAGRMGVPTVPLTELYNAAGDYIRRAQGNVEFRASVESFRAELSHVKLNVAGGEREVSTSWYSPCRSTCCRKCCPTRRRRSRCATRSAASRPRRSPAFISGSIARLPISTTPCCSTAPSSGCSTSRSSRSATNNGHGSYVELVVSSSKTLVEKSRQEIVDLALSELREFFPAARDANLVKSTVIKEVHATYSPRPGIEADRPRPETVWPRVFLAGDWTATGWPATMEGAVRSGYLAAQSLAKVAGLRDASFLVPDLPARGFMRLFG